MSITTQRGDSGNTDLMFGRRVRKTHPRVVACGEIDELNAALGWARVVTLSPQVRVVIAARQRELVGLMGELATLPEDVARYHAAGYARMTPETVVGLTAEAAAWESRLDWQGRDWAMPGAAATPSGAALDVARAVCRRAERAVTAVWDASPRQDELALLLVYLNRLSDLLWLLARWEEQSATGEREQEAAGRP